MHANDKIFFDEYKRLEALCNHLIGEQIGVTGYINLLEAAIEMMPDDAASLGSAWEKLRYARDIRNRLAHETESDYEPISTSADLISIQDFCKLIETRRDPLGEKSHLLPQVKERIAAGAVTIDNTVFFEEFKRLEAVCSDLCKQKHGVSAYIEFLKQVLEHSEYRHYDWELDLKRLKQARRLRNDIAHPGSKLNSTVADLAFITAFRKKIEDRTDPLNKKSELLSFIRSSSPEIEEDNEVSYSAPNADAPIIVITGTQSTSSSSSIYQNSSSTWQKYESDAQKVLHQYVTPGCIGCGALMILILLFAFLTHM